MSTVATEQSLGSSLSGGSFWGAAASVLDSAITNITNAQVAKKNRELQEATNAQNLELMYKSWERDDTAVQRRVKDLKEAGLSPLLAAGSAAGNSGPIQLTAPQNRFQMNGLGLLSAVQAVQSVKGAMLDNKLKELGIKYYGMPDWLSGILKVINDYPEDNPVRQALSKVLGWLNGNGSSSPSPSPRPTPAGTEPDSTDNMVRGERPWLPDLDKSGPNSPQATFVLGVESIDGKNYDLHLDKDRYNKLVNDLRGKGQGQLNNYRQRVFRYYSLQGYTDAEIEFIWKCALEDSGH